MGFVHSYIRTLVFRRNGRDITESLTKAVTFQRFLLFLVRGRES